MNVSKKWKRRLTMCVVSFVVMAPAVAFAGDFGEAMGAGPSFLKLALIPWFFASILSALVLGVEYWWREPEESWNRWTRIGIAVAFFTLATAFTAVFGQTVEPTGGHSCATEPQVERDITF